MQITTSGKLTKVSPILCREAVRYFATQLLSKRTLNNITIRLIFSDEIRDCATCVQNNKRSYTIIVKNNMGVRKTLLSIAHEMVHIKQWATGEMKDYIRIAEKCRWQGKRYNSNDDNDDYWSQPWEIEAFGREIGLYKTFMKEPQYAVCRQ